MLQVARRMSQVTCVAANVYACWCAGWQVGALDAQWVDFLATVKNLETGAQLRSFSSLDPLEEFRLESGACIALWSAC